MEISYVNQSHCILTLSGYIEIDTNRIIPQTCHGLYRRNHRVIRQKHIDTHWVISQKPQGYIRDIIGLYRRQHRVISQKHIGLYRRHTQGYIQTQGLYHRHHRVISQTTQVYIVDTHRVISQTPQGYIVDTQGYIIYTHRVISQKLIGLYHRNTQGYIIETHRVRSQTHTGI